MADNQTRIVISALDQTKAGLDSVRNNLSGIQSAAAAVGLSLSVMGMVALVKQSIDVADALNDMSQRLGVGIKELTGYKLAAEQSGTSLEGLGKGIKGLAVNMAEHGGALKAAGITAKDADGAMRQIADLFAKMPDGIEKTALATKLFGKSGMDMIPMLNMGSKGLSEAAEKSAQYAAAMAALAPRADKFNDNMALLSMNGQMLGMTLVNALMPNLILTSEAMAVAAREGNILYAVFRGIAGLGKIPLDLYTGSNGTVDVSSQKMIFDLKAQLGQLERNKESGGGSVLGKLLFGSNDEIDKKIAIIKNQIAAFEKFGAGLDKNLADAAKPKAPDTSGIKGWMDEYKKMMSALGGTDEHAKAIKASADYIAALTKETAAIGMNVYGRKYQEAAAKMQTAATQGQRDEIMKGFAAWSLATQAEEANTAAKKANEEAVKAALAAQQSITIGLNTEAVALKDKADAAELENEKIGKTAAQLAGLAAIRYDEQIAILYASEALQNDAATRDANIALIEQQIESLRRLSGAAAARPALEASAEAIKKQADAWKKFTGDIESSLTDALMRGFENGNSFGENFVKTLENTLETAALKIVVQAIVDPVMGGINSLSTGGSLLSGAGSVGDLYGSVGSLFTTGGGMASMAGSTALMSTAAPTLSAATLGAGSGAAATAGVGSMVMTAMPYLAAAYAVYSLITADHGTPASHTGDTSATFGAGGTLTGSTTWGGSNANTDAVVAGMESSYMASAKQLGLTAAVTQFAYGGNTGAEGKNPQFALGGGVAGQAGFYQNETTASPEAIQLAASRAVLTALQGSEMPAYLHKMFNGLTAGAMTQADINNALGYAASLKQVRDALTETRTPTEIFNQNLADAKVALGTTAETFKTDFITAIDAGISPEKLAQWQALGTVIGTAAQTAANAMRVASDSMLAFTNDVMGIVNKIHGSVTDSIFNMQYGMQDTAGKYGMLGIKGAGLDAQMRATTDIFKIADFAQQEIDLLNTSWGLLDVAQQKATFGQFQDKLGGIDSFVTSSGATAIEIRKAQNTELSTAVADAVKQALEELGQKMADATTAVAAAKREPANVQIDITNNSNSEVFVR